LTIFRTRDLTITWRMTKWMNLRDA
jgi:hypothetical protein